MKKTTTFFRTLIAALFLCSLSSQAQIFSIVGNGTTYNDAYTYPAPYGNWFWFSKHQFYISPAEMIAAGVAPGAQISSLGFNDFGNNSLTYLTQWAVAIFTTTSTDPLVSGMLTTGQVASSGAPLTSNFIPSIGWNTHTVTPFIWNGTDGIVVQTCHAHNSGYSYNASTYWTTNLTGSSTKSRWYYQDNVTACQNSGNAGTSTTTRPNIRFEWISPNPCTGAPAPNSVVGPTSAICPNASAQLGFASSYTLGGITYSWYTSTTSSVGPWTSVAGSQPIVSVPNQTTNAYFMAVASCSAGGTTSLTAFQVSVQPVIINTPPYFEGFEGIANNNELPNCSWAASALGNGQQCQTYTSSNNQNRWPRTGNKFASFYYSPAGNNYFYTNGLYLTAGVTYSAAVWYITDYYGYNNWSDLSIMLGPNQSTTGLVTIASSNGPAISNVYKKLSNTFTVATTGVYYVAIKSTVNTSSYAYYLSWDDLSITIPCTPGSNNVPTVAVAADNQTICAGETVNLTATGATTYTWSNGSTADNLSEQLYYNTDYQVVGTNTLTGCTSTVNQSILVNPTPNIVLFTNKYAICAGQSVNLTALGGVSYTWSGSSSNANMISVSPLTSTTYTVSGANAFGCTKMATQAITVNPLPTISASSARPSQICVGESVVLTATGGSSFSWISNTSSSILSGANVNVSPSTTTNYTVTGTDINGCSNVATLTQVVDACTGLSEAAAAAGFNVYPNPSSGAFVVESLNNINGAQIEVVDLTGKVVFRNTINNGKVIVNLDQASNGVYFMKVQSQGAVNIVKLIKQ